MFLDSSSCFASEVFQLTLLVPVCHVQEDSPLARTKSVSAPALSSAVLKPLTFELPLAFCQCSSSSDCSLSSLAVPRFLLTWDEPCHNFRLFQLHQARGHVQCSGLSVFLSWLVRRSITTASVDRWWRGSCNDLCFSLQM